ncbi:S-layer homology domain-containing protein [Cohnella sp. LGH]|uniref:S-layer homology domain-containing protein n=1 Tax=Cohnella sp. LGH TaxID=1619153 RepID=UPI001ADACCD6|nr:S-layer homology domain-containing protein [Cohnella sp. LGH]QTH41381.1 S-layer homology domain-containing protein [Cohnella sp. LGH]
MRNHKVKPIIAAVMALLLMGLSLLEGFGGKAYAAGREIMATVAGSGSMAFSGVFGHSDTTHGFVFEVSAGNALFTDTDGSWARQWIELLAGVEVVKGGSDGRFNPSAYGTREQAVAMILRMLTVCRNVDLQWAD